MSRTRRRKMVFVDLWSGNGGSTDPVELFNRQCSPIYTLYTHGLHASEAKILATTSWTRIFPTLEVPIRRPGGEHRIDENVRVDDDEPADNMGFGETVSARIDASLLMLEPALRGAGYLEWLHAVMIAIARSREWDETPLAAARQFCLDQKLTAHFESNPKQSPGRLHKAILSVDIDPDGQRHLAITVRDRAGEVVQVAAKTYQPFWLDFYDWRTVRARFRWTSEDTVEANYDWQIGDLPLHLGYVRIAAHLGPVIQVDLPD